MSYDDDDGYIKIEHNSTERINSMRKAKPMSLNLNKNTNQDDNQPAPFKLSSSRQ